MPRTALTKTDGTGNYAASLQLVTMTAADVANKNAFQCSGNDLIVVHNTGGVQYTVTLTSVDYPPGRSGTITAETIDAGVIKIYGPLKAQGWQQSDGKIYLEANNAAVKFGIIKLT